MDSNKKKKDIVKFINESNQKKIKEILFSSSEELCLFSLDALISRPSLIHFTDLIDLFKENKSNVVNNKILEVLIKKIEINEINKVKSHLIDFLEHLRNNLNFYKKNDDILKNTIYLLHKFNLLGEEMINELLNHPDENILVFLISLLKRDHKTFKTILPLLKKDDNLRCEVLKKIPEDITSEYIKILMENMENGTPKIQQTIINSLSEFNQISDSLIPLLKHSLTIISIRTHSIKLLNKVNEINTSQIFIEEYYKLKKDKEKSKFDPNYFLSLIEAISNTHDISLFPLISEVFNGYFSPCFQYVLNYLINIANKLNGDNIQEILISLKLHKDLIITKDFLLQKLIKFTTKVKQESLITFLIEITSEIKNQHRQIDIINLLELLPIQKKREIIENLNLDLYSSKIKKRLELFKNELKFKKMSEYF